MALLKFSDIGISALAAAVPRKIINNYEYSQHFSPEEVKEVVDKIGIYERRFAEPGVCASDLCYAAAERLIADQNISRHEIDVLIFVSQTPDYRMPATSVILQHRLKLGKQVIAFDINMGCSGFLHGMAVVFGLMQNQNLRKALLLDGETRSRVYSQKDRKTAFIFGDGGVAALIERNEKFGDSHFSLNSDGSRENLIKMDAGGARNPTTIETLKEKVVDEFGNIRSDEHGYMNGSEVFNFVILEIPPDIKKILEYAQVEKDTIDYFVFHQANSFMNSYLAKKLKLDPEKVPSTLYRFGNTSSVSIPLTIASELRNKLDDKKILLSGFGVGMTWASCIFNAKEMFISELVEV